MAFANGSFETADSGNPGLAQSWTLTTVAAITIAGYILTSGIERAWEDFDDGWVTNYSFAFGDSPTIATYSVGLVVPAPTFENFDAGWGLDEHFFTDLGGMESAEYGTIPEEFDSFENGWGDDSFATDLDPGIMTIATYGSGADEFDTFSVEWFTGTYDTSLGSTTAAVYNNGADAFEGFDNVFPPISFVPSTVGGTGVFTAIAHGMSNGRRVLLTSTGSLPEGLSDASYYFIVAVTTDTFELEAAPGSGGLPISSQGVGTHFVNTDGLTEWGEVLA